MFIFSAHLTMDKKRLSYYSKLYVVHVTNVYFYTTNKICFETMLLSTIKYSW